MKNTNREMQYLATDVEPQVLFKTGNICRRDVCTIQKRQGKDSAQHGEDSQVDYPPKVTFISHHEPFKTSESGELLGLQECLFHTRQRNHHLTTNR